MRSVVDDVLTIEVGAAQAEWPALAVVSEALPDVATADLRQLFVLGGVTRDGGPCTQGVTLAAGDRLEVLVGSAGAGLPRIAPRRLKGFDVLRADAEVWACFKPAGVSVEAERDGTHTFKAAIFQALAPGLRRPRVVHRLDKETSGAILVALSRGAMQELTRQLEAREVRKEYLALVARAPREERGVVELPLREKEARTRWEVEERFGRHALIRAFPETGRMHQIRQHLAAIGLPLVADSLHGDRSPLLLSQLKRNYRPPRGGAERPLLARLGLHAQRLAWRDPTSGEPREVEAELPKDLRVALKQLRKYDAAV